MGFRTQPSVFFNAIHPSVWKRHSRKIKSPQAPVYFLLSFSYLSAKAWTRRMYARQGKSGPGSRWSLPAI